LNCSVGSVVVVGSITLLFVNVGIFKYINCHRVPPTKTFNTIFNFS
jgi:hypothetical protein